MFLHITLHDVTPDKTHDHFLDSTVEVYQTWLMTRLDPLVGDPGTIKATDGRAVQLARTGYSLRGAPDDGVSLEAKKPAQAQLVLDPQISFDLPDDAINKDQRYLFRLQFFWWESDRGTQKVRTTFSDPTLQVFVDAMQATKEDSASAKAAAAKWVDENWQGLVKAAVVASGVGANPWVQVGLQLLPGIETLVQLAVSHGDTFIDRHQFVISTRGTGDSLEWFVVPPTGDPSASTKGVGTQSFDDLPVLEGNGNTKLRGTYVVRVID